MRITLTRNAVRKPGGPSGRLREMDLLLEITPDEIAVLTAARDGPIADAPPQVRQACINLQGRRLMQQAGAIAQANGWAGSPHAFILTRQGWNLLKLLHSLPAYGWRAAKA